MTLFIRLLDAENKAEAMAEAVAAVREGCTHPRVFEVNPESFAQVPGSPFAYWVSDKIRLMFRDFNLMSKSVFLGKGPDTGDDFRFLRLFWEIEKITDRWVMHPKGGKFSPYYSDVHLTINWHRNGSYVAITGNMRNISFMGNPGLTWPRRTNGLSFRVMPAGCIFADKGPAAFVANDDPEMLLALVAILNSAPFKYLVSVQLARTELAQSYEVGVIQRTPLPEIPDAIRQQLTDKARRAWSIQRQLDTTNETSHAFVLPALLRTKLGGWNPDALKAELQQIQAEIDVIAFDLYGFNPEDREAVAGLHTAVPDAEIAEDDED